MSTVHDPLTALLADPSFREVLNQLGIQLRIDQPNEVLIAALSIIALANQERGKGARLLLHYPNGDYNEMVYWKPQGPKLVVKDGKRLDE
jgi:hypothetical protein